MAGRRTQQHNYMVYFKRKNIECIQERVKITTSNNVILTKEKNNNNKQNV